MKVTYKLVAALLALAVVAVLVFTPLVLVRIQSTAAQMLVYIAQATGNSSAQDMVDSEGKISDHIGIDISIAGLWGDDAQGTSDLLKQLSDGDTTRTLKILEPVIAPFFTFVVALVFVALCALAAAIIAIVAKDNRKVIYPCVAGIGFSLMVPTCFKVVAMPFLSEKITLSQLGGSSWIALLGKIDGMELSSNFWFVVAIFAAIILWTVLYNYTLPADEKKKRLIMIGEAEEE